MAEARQVAKEAHEAMNDQRKLLAEMRATLREYEHLFQGYIH